MSRLHMQKRTIGCTASKLNTHLLTGILILNWAQLGFFEMSNSSFINPNRCKKNWMNKHGSVVNVSRIILNSRQNILCNGEKYLVSVSIKRESCNTYMIHMIYEYDSKYHCQSSEAFTEYKCTF